MSRVVTEVEPLASPAGALPAAGEGVRPRTIGPIDASTPVLVVGARTHGGLGIIRSLGRLGVPVSIVESGPRGPAAESKYVDRRFAFDLSIASDEEIVERLLSIGSAMGGRPLLIPTWDETAVLVTEAYDRLSERFLLPHQPDGLAAALTSKKDMYFLAKRDGIPTPEVVFPASVDDVRTFAETAEFPVMLKAIDGNRLMARTGLKMVIVATPEELVRRYVELEDPDEPNLMLQEYIPGGDDIVWMFNGYFDRQSEGLVALTGRKIRQTPVYTGATSLGVCELNETVADTTLRWMKRLGYQGILDIGYRFDARDGQYKVLDVNPRIGATFRLFVSGNGMDVARALYLDLTGQPVPIAEQPVGRRWLVERDIASSLQYRRDGKLTLRQWLASLRGVEELGYFARDDMRPFAALLTSIVTVLGGRVGGLLRKRPRRAPAPPDTPSTAGSRAGIMGDSQPAPAPQPERYVGHER
jgi:predicted ATP-grasp superfamily ATP-dependent carboligase